MPPEAASAIGEAVRHLARTDGSSAGGWTTPPAIAGGSHACSTTAPSLPLHTHTHVSAHTASSADPAVLSRRRVACGVARLVCRDTRRRELERYPAYRAAAERGSTHQRREFVQYAHTIFITNTWPDMFEDTRPHRAVLQLWGGVRRAPRLMLPPGPR